MLRRGAKTLVFWFSRAFFVFFVCFFWFFLVFPRLFAFLRFCSCFSLKNDFFAVGNKCFARGFAWKWGFRSRFCLKTAVLLEVLVENSCFARSFAWKLVFRSRFLLARFLQKLTATWKTLFSTCFYDKKSEKILS